MANVLANDSDSMMCSSYADLVFHHKKDNDGIFLNHMTTTVPLCVRSVCDEYYLWTDSLNSRKYECTSAIMTRGGNYTCKEKNIMTGYNAFPNKVPNDFLLVPCPSNTFRNHVDCDENKCCSVNHQLFNNWTKRR